MKKAIMQTRRLAKEGPRVAAVLKIKDGKFLATPGYIDADTNELTQVVLVTPDGRLWVPMPVLAVLKVNH